MRRQKIINILIAIVWFINGLYCKILNLVPRHQEIVGNILSQQHARILTILIGIAEIVMAIWIITRIKSKLNAITQIIIIALMNILEFFTSSELLLWGKLNILWAFLFIIIIYYNEFLNKIINKSQND